MLQYTLCPHDVNLCGAEMYIFPTTTYQNVTANNFLAKNDKVCAYRIILDLKAALYYDILQIKINYLFAVTAQIVTG